VSTVALVPLVVVLALAATGLWVYFDAQHHAALGRPVSFQYGSLVVDTPGGWSVGVLLLSVVFLPLYLVSRT
jgi:hypothetical protein